MLWVDEAVHRGVKPIHFQIRDAKLPLRSRTKLIRFTDNYVSLGHYNRSKEDNMIFANSLRRFGDFNLKSVVAIVGVLLSVFARGVEKVWSS
ncbi:MAG: hypothetical protein R3C56_13445 [Pirellulaceae bacterium]